MSKVRLIFKNISFVVGSDEIGLLSLVNEEETRQLIIPCDKEMVCDTPVPYYRTTVSCGRPNEFGDVPAEEILLPSMMIS